LTIEGLELCRVPATGLVVSCRHDSMFGAAIDSRILENNRQMNVKIEKRACSNLMCRDKWWHENKRKITKNT
jgi:hypothetical protein